MVDPNFRIALKIRSNLTIGHCCDGLVYGKKNLHAEPMFIVPVKNLFVFELFPKPTSQQLQACLEEVDTYLAAKAIGSFNIFG